MDLKSVPPNTARGVVGFCSWVVMGLGAGLLWGAGAGLLLVGAAVWIDVMSDEALERITGIKRSND